MKNGLNRVARRAFEFSSTPFCIIFQGGSFGENYVYFLVFSKCNKTKNNSCFMIFSKNKNGLNRVARRAFEVSSTPFCIIFQGGSFGENILLAFFTKKQIFSFCFKKNKNVLNRVARRAFDFSSTPFCIIFQGGSFGEKYIFCFFFFKKQKWLKQGRQNSFWMFVYTILHHFSRRIF